MTEFSELLKSIGWPGTILVICGAAAWRIIVFCRPYVEAAFKSHIAFVDTATAQSVHVGKAIDGVLQVIDHMRQTQDHVVKASTEQHADKIELLKTMQSQHANTHDLISEIHAVVVRPAPTEK
jgi:hypothetical protein